MMRMKCFLAVFITMLAGCDQVQDVMAKQPKPNVMLGAGIEVQVGDNQTAKVFGPDLCETGFGDDDPSDDVPGCTLLTGNDQVQVTLLVDGRKLRETWAVTRDNDRYTLARPNGYLIRNPGPHN
ncbi:hypothetical protein EZI54_07040 [Marinobacter halodurans]|uniref:Lipoprotein n=1 Tax=Marinobacter halodurans TaxID=2528979 RepID=A0ABY1ZMK6_9GAMM|nr:hypothetical protein [Marinobacter halodurans]TBW57406.1 hypothetical protein EZI54_07040 [Marinobacter halodurans]